MVQAHHSLKFFQPLPQLCVLHVPAFYFFGELLVQPLDRGQRHAAFIHYSNVFVVQADTEGGVKILCHRADMFDAWILFIVPLRDRQRIHLLENLWGAHLFEVHLGVAVTDADERAVDRQAAAREHHQLGATASVVRVVIVRAAGEPGEPGIGIRAEVLPRILNANTVSGARLEKVDHLPRLIPKRHAG